MLRQSCTKSNSSSNI